jgi:ferredoxin
MPPWSNWCEGRRFGTSCGCVVVAIPSSAQVSLSERAFGTMTHMKISVNYDLCESNALCCFAAPDVFEVREDELLYVIDENPSEAKRTEVYEAVNACPKRAITVDD